MFTTSTSALQLSTASPTPASSNIFRQSLTPAPIALFEQAASSPIPATPAASAELNSPTSFSAPQLPTTANPFIRPNIKLSVRSSRSKPMTRPILRSRGSPKSPLKRVFGPSPDSGNQAPPVAGAEIRGQENATLGECPISLSPATRRNVDRPTRHSMHLDVSGSSKNGISKFVENNGEPFPPISVSPLKRSDATMSLGQASFGSPVAKRRSLHGISTLGTDPSVFDQTPAPAPAPAPQSFDIHEDGNHEYQLTGACPSPFRDIVPPPTPSGLPKRSSSLRKSTLQQRYGDNRMSFSRRAAEKQLAQFSMEAASPNSRSRPRLSLDQYIPPDERGSPFNQGPLPNPAAHPLPRPANQPHPLSRSLTQSSSGSSLPDDSPTHIPTVHVGERPRVPLNFSKSLPPGSQRPVNDSEPVATPQYKHAKPLQAAFMSTGLVSKMNRNTELDPLNNPGAKTAAAMPDTPCKKQPYNSATFPPQGGSGGRRSRISFGSPSTPFSAIAAPIRGNPFGNQDRSGSLLFQSVRSGHTRSGSMLSLDGDDLSGAHDELPPTPTKNLFFKSLSTPAGTAQNLNDNRSFSARPSPFVLGSDFRAVDSEPETMKDVPSTDDQGEVSQPVERISRPSTPFSNGSPRLGFSFASLGGSRTQPVSFATPAPRRTSPVFFATVNNVANHYSKTNLPEAESPLNMDTGSPHTPQDAVDDEMAPPDPSNLSISNSQDGFVRSRTPATPSNSHARQLFSSFASRRLSITPQNGHGPSELDESLVTRFEKSEVVGKGEFSQVYRVVKSSAPSSFMTAFSTTPRTPSSPEPGRVYAVKKLRIPFHGIREREARLREVAILQALTHSSKIVQYMDSWEHNGHLYIQTEYCTEGSLDGFLKSVGQAGRLDDFRIWKILLETAQGLLAIHQAGFIHLDIKPANIFITFDGYLKIGDFGMATTWPAPKGIEGEGDREYIGPEILLGRYDQPADIFALGLIILEIACNVFLPDNGPTWQALRNGDLSTVPTLTCGEAGAIRAELQDPPSFMLDPNDPLSLDKIVTWMIQPNPADRPTAEQLLVSEPVAWISNRRTAGATVFEGNWGPQIGLSVDELVDTEMTDV
ncbi:mitosis inhibitor protein kinase swe1 [Collariella sp. IMI 366227]|nr:mitosis inhibitor protein kinase swe1 [Collariella sp. IMI 366227]